jgi:hypothetical protein
MSKPGRLEDRRSPTHSGGRNDAEQAASSRVDREPASDQTNSRRAQADAIGHLKPSAGLSSWAKTSQFRYDGSEPMMCVANIKAASDMTH